MSQALNYTALRSQVCSAEGFAIAFAARGVHGAASSIQMSSMVEASKCIRSDEKYEFEHRLTISAEVETGVWYAGYQYAYPRWSSGNTADPQD